MKPHITTLATKFQSRYYLVLPRKLLARTSKYHKINFYENYQSIRKNQNVDLKITVFNTEKTDTYLHTDKQLVTKKDKKTSDKLKPMSKVEVDEARLFSLDVWFLNTTIQFLKFYNGTSLIDIDFEGYPPLKSLDYLILVAVFAKIYFVFYLFASIYLFFTFGFLLAFGAAPLLLFLYGLGLYILPKVCEVVSDFFGIQKKLKLSKYSPSEADSEDTKRKKREAVKQAVRKPFSKLHNSFFNRNSLRKFFDSELLEQDIYGDNYARNHDDTSTKAVIHKPKKRRESAVENSRCEVSDVTNFCREW